VIRSLAFQRFAVPAELPAGTWTGPWAEPGFELHEVIPSWNALTPPGSLVEVELQARNADRTETGWYALGRWTFDDEAFERTSVPGQEDAFGTVATDTFRAAASLLAYRLRLTLSAGRHGPPVVRLLGAVASSGEPAGGDVSAPGAATGVELNVPSYAQSIHGEIPQYGGGGAAWCSPTSTAMVMEYWDYGPSAADLVWVGPALMDPCVDHAARFTFDVAYDGTGNWPFNTAYAAHFGLDAFVTRLRSLQEAEVFVAAGIPLVTSIAAGPGELKGFLLPEGTAGHLVVIVGFTPEGDPIVNDPAAPSNDAVRRTYRRAEFESVWLNGSGGAVYVITPPGTALPPSSGNW
jgi:hypothetical protein